VTREAYSLLPVEENLFLNRSLLMLLVTIAFATSLLGQQEMPRVAAPGPARMEQLVEANIVGVHAYQILLARKQTSMDPACWPTSDPKDTDFEALVAHQTSLLSAPAAARG